MDWLVIMALAIYLAVVTLMGKDGRLAVGLALAMLLAAAMVLAQGDQGLAEKLAIYAGYTFLAGAIACLIEKVRQKTSKRGDKESGQE